MLALETRYDFALHDARSRRVNRTFPSMSMTFRAQRATLMSLLERPKSLLDDILILAEVSNRHLGA